jgi:membrane-associated protein
LPFAPLSFYVNLTAVRDADAIEESGMDQLFSQIQDVFLAIIKFDNNLLMATLAKPEIMLAAFIVLNVVVFVETGLFFFLPGDSMLVTAGIVAWISGWPVVPLIITLSLSAIIGDSVGYYVGRKAGPRLFTRDKSFFFRKDYLEAAQRFYERHGGKTIIIARFIPIIRTFAPIIAGAAKMNYRRFLTFNVIGGIGWVVSMILLGYFLTPVVDPMLKPIFGDGFQVQKHIEKVIIIVVLLSIAPGLYAGTKAWLKKRRAAKEPAPVADEPLKTTPTA